MSLQIIPVHLKNDIQPADDLVDLLLSSSKTSLENGDVLVISQKIISKLLGNIAPSKHSTFAPMQFFLFGWMVDIDNNYEELKFNSRFPSALFSVLTIYITFLLSKIRIFSVDPLPNST